MTTNTVQFTPEQIVQHYYRALNARQPALAAPFLAEDVVRIGVMATDGPPHRTQGKIALLARMQRIVDDNGALTVYNVQAAGNTITCSVQIATDTMRREKIAPLEENAEFLIQDGRIKSYRVVSTPEAMAKIKATTH